MLKVKTSQESNNVKNALIFNNKLKRETLSTKVELIPIQLHSIIPIVQQGLSQSFLSFQLFGNFLSEYLKLLLEETSPQFKKNTLHNYKIGINKLSNICFRNRLTKSLRIGILSLFLIEISAKHLKTFSCLVIFTKPTTFIIHFTL